LLLKLKYKLFFKLYPIKKNSVELASEKSMSSFKQIYVLNAYILWLFILKYYKDFKNKNTNISKNGKDFTVTDSYNYLGKSSLVHIKFNYVLTKHVSKVFTILRSPMAQKKFSKEQIGFRYYNLNFTIKIDSNIFFKYNINLSQKDVLLYFILFIKSEFFYIFCGLCLFHGINVSVFIKYFYNPVWKNCIN